MHTVFRFLRQLLLTVLLLALLALVAAGGYFAVTGHKLYESAIQVTPIDTLYSSISSREGFVPYAQLPQTYINAVISAEDSRFTHHKGVDPVSIARALVKMPRILLLDEPLSNLDARLRLQTREEIRRIQKATGITTVFVTHDQEEAMSISDLIVVMKDGVVQQIGKPQAVYDSPVNLFVAKFLGTPPINVFDGEVKGGQLYIGEEAVLAVPGVANQSVTAAIRPEGFTLSETGALSCDLSRVEVMGRDISVVSTHPKSQNVTIRSIISAENAVNTASQKVRFDLKPNKVFLFQKESGARIVFG